MAGEGPESGSEPAADAEVLPWRQRPSRTVTAFVSRAARRAAQERGIDINALAGTGANGRVTLADIEGATGLAGNDDVVPFNNIRKRAATLLLASKRAAAHALCVAATDYSAIEAARRPARAEWREAEGFSLTALPFVARAVVDALRAFPLVNASVANDDNALVVHHGVNLGIAVDLDFEGLVVPVVRGADGLRLRALARAINDVATRARARKLTPDDLAGGTFTITNPGASGTWISFPIINQPQVAIVSTDGISKQVVCDERGKLAIAPIGNLCLTFDHRAMDGAYAAAFLERVRETIETRDWTLEL
jgi:2-oxoglutarate dehydrogenase E2 component (dihydrolipoamide succinyltransferase)